MAEDQGNSSIVLDIQFEDGSVQKGFVRIANLSQQTAQKVGNDFKGTKLIDFEKFGEEGVSALRNIGGEFVKFGAAAFAVGVAVAGIKKGFDLALDGEKIIAVNAQFDILTQQAGIAGDALRAGLEKSADGLVDMDELLQKANSAVINLGSNASRLPEVLDLARKATAALGGDLQERFVGIVSAIESGNARALKSQGIIIDGEKAFKDYARSLGVGAGELDKAQQQQAILNAAIDQGGKKFKDAATNVQPLTDNLTRLKTILKEAADAFSVMIAKSETLNVLTEAALGFAKSFDAIKNVDSVPKLTKDINLLQGSIAAATEKLAGFNAVEKLFLGGDFEDSIKKDTARLNELTKKLAEAQKVQADALKTAGTPATGGGGSGGGGSKNKSQLDLDRAAALELASARNRAALSQNGIEAAQTAFLLQESDKRLANEALFEQKRALIMEQGRIKEEQIRAQGLSGVIAREDDLKAKILDIRTSTSAELAKVELDNAKNTEAYTKAVEGQAARVSAISNGLRNVVFAGAESIGRSLQKGTMNWNDFGTSVVGVVGDMCIQLGQALVVQGLAVDLFSAAINTLLPGSGAAAAAAGVGLIIFGSALKAAVGAGGSTSTASAGGGVASGAVSGGTMGTITKPEELERKKPDTYVNLTVQGDVFDSSETGFRIADLLNRAFDKNGIVLNGAV